MAIRGHRYRGRQSGSLLGLKNADIGTLQFVTWLPPLAALAPILIT